jgi:2-polyprenyl-3-methyl-5-hydroxy-6-metoxy-1,4-benzoquinol methylase
MRCVTVIERDKEMIIRRYNERLKKYGTDLRALAVGNMERQIVRYTVLSQIGTLNTSSILDVGCGFGDFYGFLLSKGFEVDYTGCDINAKLINIAKEKYPSAKFQVADILDMNDDRKFDYVISSSAFNNKLQHEDNYVYISDVIQKCFALCKVGVAINMMTNYVDFETEHAFHYSPEKIFSICKELSKRVTLRHDYCLFGFTIYLYKKECEWKKRLIS